MATRPTSSRSASSAGSSRSRSSGRGARGGSGGNAQPFVFGGIGLVVVIALIAMMNRGGNGSTQAGNATAAEQAAKPAAQPAAPARTPVKLEASKAGGPPKRPAPALTEATLQQARDLLATAKTLCNEGITARTAGDNTKARERQSLAKTKIDELKKLVAAASLWQEEAQLENWAQPAEYMTLEKLLGELGPLEKRVRMGGGT
ncbi:MAG: hypothetical protein JNK78_13345 [Planctomycetes bacterium]|nr:hypothetical protein [Planctomycetota bacterium]